MSTAIIVATVFAALGRLADIYSTYSVTPTLATEWNPIAKKFGWWYVIVTSVIAVAAVPFFGVMLGLVVGYASFSVAYRNMNSWAFARHHGEEACVAAVLANEKKASQLPIKSKLAMEIIKLTFGVAISIFLYIIAAFVSPAVLVGYFIQLPWLLPAVLFLYAMKDMFWKEEQNDH